jgi:hypothetical protein
MFSNEQGSTLHGQKWPESFVKINSRVKSAVNSMMEEFRKRSSVLSEVQSARAEP